MKILFLADAVFEDLPGGSRVAARELARKLMARGHEATFLVGRQSPSSLSDEIMPDGRRVVRYDGAGSGLDFVKNGETAARRLWNRQTFDIVHTHFAYASVGPLRAIPKSVPRVRTFHGPWDEETYFEEASQATSPISRFKAKTKSYICWMVERNNLKSSSAIIALSNFFRRKLSDRYGIPASSVTLLPGGADLERFEPSKNKLTTRQEIGLSTDRKILLSVRRLAPRMGLDNLVKAMPMIAAKHPDVLLLIGGKGPQQKQLEGLITEHKLENNVKLIGFIADDKLAAYYQSADVFVLPTTVLEGFGLVTTEALACGTPVIGTPIGATPEILGGLSKNLISPGIQPDHLASTIISFLDSDWPKELQPAKLNQYVRDNYTWDKHADGVEAIYEKLVPQSRPVSVLK